MSLLFFHSQTRTCALATRERARMAVLCVNITAAVFGLAGDERKRALIPQDWSDAHPISGGGESGLGLDERLRLLLSGSFGGRCFTDGTRIFDLVLNTTMAAGSRPLALCAALHGGCETHAYVEPGDTSWLIEIIREGITNGVFASEAGWLDVIDLLGREPGPVVTSYSGRERFPNPTAARWTPTPRDGPGGTDDVWDGWYELPAPEQWRLAMAGLRGGRILSRLDPGDWPRLFGERRTAFHYADSVPRPEVFHPAPWATLLPSGVPGASSVDPAHRGGARTPGPWTLLRGRDQVRHTRDEGGPGGGR